MAANVTVDYNALVREDRVHSRVYIDQQIFEDEMERIFHRGWVFVGHASEIPDPGDYRLAWLGRYPIIMVRGEDGEVRLYRTVAAIGRTRSARASAGTRGFSVATITAGCTATTASSPR